MVDTDKMKNLYSNSINAIIKHLKQECSSIDDTLKKEYITDNDLNSIKIDDDEEDNNNNNNDDNNNNNNNKCVVCDNNENLLRCSKCKKVYSLLCY